MRRIAANRRLAALNYTSIGRAIQARREKSRKILRNGATRKKELGDARSVRRVNRRAARLQAARRIRRRRENVLLFESPFANQLLGAGGHPTKLSGEQGFSLVVERRQLGLHFRELSATFTTTINLLFTFGKGHFKLLLIFAVDVARVLCPPIHRAGTRAKGATS